MRFGRDSRLVSGDKATCFEGFWGWIASTSPQQGAYEKRVEESSDEEGAFGMDLGTIRGCNTFPTSPKTQ